MGYYNRGDTMELILDYVVDGIPLEEYEPAEIEFSIGPKRYTLTDGDITIDEDTGKYMVFVSQEDTFAMSNNVTEYQLRVKKGIEVGSESIQRIPIGRTISKEIL